MDGSTPRSPVQRERPQEYQEETAPAHHSTTESATTHTGRLEPTGGDAAEGPSRGTDEGPDAVVVQKKGSRCQNQNGLTSALILTEEKETQSRNITLRGTAEDQSGLPVPSLLGPQSRVLVPPALTDGGREKHNTCESGCSPGHTPTPSPEGPSGPQGTNPDPSPTSLVPPVCLYSANTFDPLDYLTKLHQYLL